MAYERRSDAKYYGRFRARALLSSGLILIVLGCSGEAGTDAPRARLSTAGTPGTGRTIWPGLERGSDNGSGAKDALREEASADAAIDRELDADAGVGAAADRALVDGGVDGGVGAGATFGALPSAGSGDCTRGLLEEAVYLYFQALAVGNIAFRPRAPHLRMTEQGKAVQVGKGLWAAAQELESALTAYDEGQCQTLSEVALNEAGVRRVAIVRLKVHQGLIAEVETVWVYSGRSFSPQSLANDDAAGWDSALVAADRRTRQQLLAIVDEYLDAYYIRRAGPPAFPFCTQRINGDAVSQSGCLPQLQVPVSRRRYPAVDLRTGVVGVLARYGASTLSGFLVKTVAGVVVRVDQVNGPEANDFGW